MELRPPTESIRDPFFAAVRRRHPDVDVVLLPPADPPGTVAVEVPDDGVAAALVRVATAADRLWSTVAPGGPERAETRCGFGADPSSIRAVARVASRRDDRGEGLDRLRRELERLGWDLRHSRGSGIERLTGALGGLDLTASYAEGSGALALAVSSASLPVGAARARELTRSRGSRAGDR